MFNTIWDKIALLLVAAGFSSISFMLEDIIVPLLVAMVIYSINEFFRNAVVTKLLFFLELALAILFPQFMVFFPLFLYDLRNIDKLCSVAVAVPFIIWMQDFTALQLVLYIILAGLCLFLQWKTLRYERLSNEFMVQRDNLTGDNLQLENRLRKMAEDQDKEIHMVMLEERNRIAREIHDNVGHLLSSSILQLGAAMVVEKDEGMKETLQTLKETLDKSMNSIRASVHNLRDDSIDLEQELERIISDFKFCEAKLDYEITGIPDIQLKYAIISIVKEALSNVVKHSNATQVLIKAYEHPKLFQLIIIDNGKQGIYGKSDMQGGFVNSWEQTSGMGLENIKQRVRKLGGVVNFSKDRGFRVFATFPKEV